MTDTPPPADTAWLTELPENPLHRRFRERPWVRALRWATACASMAAVACVAFTLL